MAIGGYGGAVSVWDVATASPRHRFTQAGVVTALALSPAADRVVAGGERALTVAYIRPPEAAPQQASEHPHVTER